MVALKSLTLNLSTHAALISVLPVCLHQGELQQEELFVAVEMLSAVALINQAMEAGHQQQFSSSLVSPSAGLSDVDPTLLDRYHPSTCLSHVMLSVVL